MNFEWLMHAIERTKSFVYTFATDRMFNHLFNCVLTQLALLFHKNFDINVIFLLSYRAILYRYVYSSDILMRSFRTTAIFYSIL